MVHALKKAHRLLQPGGILIDIQEVPDQRWLGFTRNGTISKAGMITDYNDFKDQRMGYQALQLVMEQGLFVQEAERRYKSLIHADTLEEFREYSPKSAARSKKVYKKAEEMSAALDAPIEWLMGEKIRMLRLQAME